jgi:hypothetical protein
MTSVLEGLVKEADLKPDVKLQPHQERVLKRLREHPANMLLFHALGSGKTLTGLAASEQTGEPFTAVVPASLRNNMRGEYEKFLDPQSQQNADVMSYSGLARGKPVRNPGVLLFDEAARLRNPATLEAQRAMELASRARQTTLLTGTPITNDPSDLAVPISMLTGRQITPKEFTDRYVGQRKVGPGFFGWLRGVPPATEPEIKRPEELKALLSGHVDYYAPQQPTVPTTQEDIPVEMSTDQSRLYRAMWGQLPWLLRWKLQHDYPLSNDDLKRATSFLVGPRQVGLSTYTFQGEHKDPLKAFQTSTKLQEAYKRLSEKLKDPRTKALIFSNFIDAGLTPYAAGLAANNIPHAVFHGGLSDKERQKLKDDYNAGKIRVALLGPSGTEGLSLKGTQLVQLLDPYWNSARGSQSKGRALRYDSHWDLPEDLKNVAVQRYTSKLPLGLTARLKQRIGFDQEAQRRAADDYLENMAARKDRLNTPFIDLLKDVGTEGEKVGHAHSAAGCPPGLTLLLDPDVPNGDGDRERTVLKSAQAWLPPGYSLEREHDGDDYVFRLLHGNKRVGGLRARRGKDTHNVEGVWLDPEHRISVLGDALASHIKQDHSGQNVMLPDGSTIPVDAITGAYRAGGFDALPPLAEKSAADEMEENARNWVKHVMQTSFATYPPPGVFTRSPQEIADAGDAPGVAPKGLTSWQRMVLFHRNRGGRGLAEERRRALQDAVQLLSRRRAERKQKPELYDPTTLLPIKTGASRKRKSDYLTPLAAGGLLGGAAYAATPQTEPTSRFLYHGMLRPRFRVLQGDPTVPGSKTTFEDTGRDLVRIGADPFTAPTADISRIEDIPNAVKPVTGGKPIDTLDLISHNSRWWALHDKLPPKPGDKAIPASTGGFGLFNPHAGVHDDPTDRMDNRSFERTITALSQLHPEHVGLASCGGGLRDLSNPSCKPWQQELADRLKADVATSRSFSYPSREKGDIWTENVDDEANKQFDTTEAKDTGRIYRPNRPAVEDINFGPKPAGPEKLPGHYLRLPWQRQTDETKAEELSRKFGPAAAALGGALGVLSPDRKVRWGSAALGSAAVMPHALREAITSYNLYNANKQLGSQDAIKDFGRAVPSAAIAAVPLLAAAVGELGRYALKPHKKHKQMHKVGKSEHFHTDITPSGHERTLDVHKLWDITKRRKPRPIPIEQINMNGVNRSRASGFSPKRYATVDTSFPIIQDYTGRLLDGRHRLFKLLDEGTNKILVHKLRQGDAERATVNKEGAVHVLPEAVDGGSGDRVRDNGPVSPADPLLHKEGRQAQQEGSAEVCGTNKAAAAAPLNSAENDDAVGIPNRSFYGEPHVGLKPGQLVDWYVSQHDARRAGRHTDIRLGTPETGLFSWASRKGLPEPGQKRLAVQQPLHSHGYGGFEGEIPSGYGAGTVKKHDVGQALITKAGPEGIHFTLAHRRFPERFLLLPPKVSGQKNWLMLNTTKTRPVPYQKAHYATIPPEKVEGVLEKLKPGSSVQAKLDGAASLTQLFKDHFEVLSYRARKDTGGPIVHTERVFHGRPEAKIPKELVGTVLRGELYGTDYGGRAIDPQELGGLLNSSVGRSIRTQGERGIRLQNMLFDIDRMGGRRNATNVRTLPYEDRLGQVRSIMPHLKQPDVFHGPEEAKDPESAKALWHQIATGKHPLTEEGIVIHPPHGKPAKVKIRGEHDVYIRSFAPGAGKYKDNAVGTFRYSHEPTGPIVGEVGTGLTDALRRDMYNNPEVYLGRVARVLSPRKMRTGALYAPALLALHEDK